MDAGTGAASNGETALGNAVSSSSSVLKPPLKLGAEWQIMKR